jgi:glycosyltransferase involved in cell wall biosynthesis
VVPLVFAGRKNGYFPVIERELRRLKLETQAFFTGYLDPEGVGCLYASARAMIIPSYFEGWGMPLTEAMQAGLPVAVADNSMLPEQAGEAALSFDPADTQAMAAALKRLWEDAGLRAGLSAKGRERVKRFGWDKAAKAFRAHYRRLGGRTLSEEDRMLISKSQGAEPLA